MNRIAAHFMLSMLDVSDDLDKLNAWMLGGTGASATLLLSNADSSSSVLSPSVAVTLLSILSISALFGIGAKINAVKIKSAKKVMSYAYEYFENHTEEEVLEILRSIKLALPWWTHGQIERDSSKGAQDSLYGPKLALRRLEYQKKFIGIQAGILVVAIFVSAALIARA